MCAKNCERWLGVDKIIAIINMGAYFLSRPCSV